MDQRVWFLFVVLTNHICGCMQVNNLCVEQKRRNELNTLICIYIHISVLSENALAWMFAVFRIL